MHGATAMNPPRRPVAARCARRGRAGAGRGGGGVAALRRRVARGARPGRPARAGCCCTPASTGCRRGPARAGRPARGPGTAAAPARHGGARPGRGRRRTRRVHPAAGDRAAAGVGVARRSRTSRRRWSWTCAPARARSRWPSRPCGRTPSCTPSRSTRTRWPGRGATSTRTAAASCSTRPTCARPDSPPRARGPRRPRLCNPPYVPDATPVPPEVRTGDPAVAVFGGADGLVIIPAVAARAASAPATRRCLRGRARRHPRRRRPRPAAGRPELVDVAEHADLNGRPRFATARRR